MLRTFCRAKIHRATVTDAELHYEGSLTVDGDLLEAAGMAPYEQVAVVNVATGDRFETYLIGGQRGSGVIALNGAAARLGQRGDLVIIMAYAQVEEGEVAALQPTVVLVDGANRIRSVQRASTQLPGAAGQPHGGRGEWA